MTPKCKQAKGENIFSMRVCMCELNNYGVCGIETVLRWYIPRITITKSHKSSGERCGAEIKGQHFYYSMRSRNGYVITTKLKQLLVIIGKFKNLFSQMQYPTRTATIMYLNAEFHWFVRFYVPALGPEQITNHQFIIMRLNVSCILFIVAIHKISCVFDYIESSINMDAIVAYVVYIHWFCSSPQQKYEAKTKKNCKRNDRRRRYISTDD